MISRVLALALLFSLGCGAPEPPPAPACGDGVAIPGEVCLAAQASVFVGGFPLALAAADFDGDGNPDLAAALNAAAAVTVLLGDGRGGFVAAAPLAVGAAPIALLTADFDRDGAPDLATVNNGDATVSVLRNAGGGRFAPAAALDITDNPTGLAALDADGDGDQDLAVLQDGIPGGAAGDDDNRVRLLTNDGAGAFTVQAPQELGVILGAGFLTAGDIDGDGDQDLVTTDTREDTLVVLLNAGGGRFVPGQELPTGGADPVAVALAPLAGDGGPLGAAVVNRGSGTASIFANEAGALRLLTTVEIGDGPAFVTAGDFDRDGDLDFATASEADDEVSVLLNAGGGAFIERDAAGNFTRFDVAGGPAAVVGADLNGDGALDLAAANTRSGEIGVLLSAP
jgi:hypothetical protein